MLNKVLLIVTMLRRRENNRVSLHLLPRNQVLGHFVSSACTVVQSVERTAPPCSGVTERGAAFACHVGTCAAGESTVLS